MRLTIWRVACTTSIITAMTVCLVPAASAVWSDPVRLSGARDAHRNPVVAVDREGDAAVAWTRLDPWRSEGDTNRRVEAWIRLRVDGDWRRGRRISTRGHQAVVQDIALDDDGDGWVMYSEQTRMYVRRLSRGGRVGTPRELGAGDHDGQIAIDGSGNALLAWSAWGGPGGTAFASYVHRDGRREPTRDLAPSPVLEGPSPALSHDGEHGLVAFGAYQWAAARRMTAPGVFGEQELVHSLPNDEQVWQIEAFVDDSGTGTVLFGSGGTYPHSWLYGVRLPAGQDPTAPWQWASGRFTSSFRAAMDQFGDIRVAWVEMEATEDGYQDPAYTLEIPAGGSPGASTRLAPDTGGVSLALRRDGTGYIGWVSPGVGTNPTIVSVTGDGSFGEPHRSPHLFEAAAQVRRKFLVAYGRTTRTPLGEAIYVRTGP